MKKSLINVQINKDILSQNENQIEKEIDKHKAFELASEIFTKPWDDITQKEKNILVYAMSHIQFFHDSSLNYNEFTKLILHCCELMTYEFAPKNNVIFHFGEKGQKFYVILKGAADIYIPRSEAEILQDFNEIEAKKAAAKKPNHAILTNNLDSSLNSDSFIKAHANTSNLLNGDETNNLGYNENFMDQKNNQSFIPTSINYLEKEIKNPQQILPPSYYVNNIPKFKRIKRIGPGSYFGEVALTTDKPRLATIIAKHDTHMVTLTKKDYKRIFDYQIMKINEKLNFFGGLFEGCSMESISKFSYAFNEKTYKFGEKIYKQGDPISYLYVVKKGEIQLIKNEIIMISKNEMEEDDDYPNKEKISSALVDLSSQKNRSEKRLMISPIQRTIANKLINIGPRSFLGEDDIFDMKAHSSTAISIDSLTILYCMPIEDYHYMSLRYPDIIQKIKSHSHNKTTILKNRISKLTNVQEKVVKHTSKSPGRSNVQKYIKVRPSTANQDLSSTSYTKLMSYFTNGSKKSELDEPAFKSSRINKQDMTEKTSARTDSQILSHDQLNLNDKSTVINNIILQKRKSQSETKLIDEQPIKLIPNKNTTENDKEHFSKKRFSFIAYSKRSTQFKSEIKKIRSGSQKLSFSIIQPPIKENHKPSKDRDTISIIRAKNSSILYKNHSETKLKYETSQYDNSQPLIRVSTARLLRQSRTKFTQSSLDTDIRNAISKTQSLLPKEYETPGKLDLGKFVSIEDRENMNISPVPLLNENQDKYSPLITQSDEIFQEDKLQNKGNVIEASIFPEQILVKAKNTTTSSVKKQHKQFMQSKLNPYHPHFFSGNTTGLSNVSRNINKSRIELDHASPSILDYSKAMNTNNTHLHHDNNDKEHKQSSPSFRKTMPKTEASIFENAGIISAIQKNPSTISNNNNHIGVPVNDKSRTNSHNALSDKKKELNNGCKVFVSWKCFSSESKLKKEDMGTRKSKGNH